MDCNKCWYSLSVSDCSIGSIKKEFYDKKTVLNYILLYIHIAIGN